MAGLDDIETFINDRPDSALAVLRVLDADSLRGPSQRARAALLHQIALDKCYIDITSDSILSPAYWYLKHGTADQKLKTWYYRSVLARNTGDVDEEMSCLIKAERYIQIAKNPQYAGFIYTAKRILYYDIFDLEDALAQAELATISFLQAGEKHRYVNALISLANITLLNKDYLKTQVLLDTLSHYKNSLSREQRNKVFGLELHFYSNGLQKDYPPDLIDDYVYEVGSDFVDWELIARARLLASSPAQALEALDRVRLTGDYYERIAYYHTKYQILDALGKSKDALESYQQYAKLLEKQSSVAVASKVRFQMLEESYTRTLQHRSLWVYILIIGVVFSSVVSVLVFRDYRKRTVQRHSLLSKQIHRLEIKNKRYKEEVRRLNELSHQEQSPSEIKELLKKRLLILNKYEFSKLSGKNIQASFALSQGLSLDDKQQFTEDILRQYEFMNPGMCSLFNQRRLTKQEKECCALIGVGFSVNDVAQFFNLSTKRIYNVSNVVRKKLGFVNDKRSLQEILMNGNSPSNL